MRALVCAVLLVAGLAVDGCSSASAPSRSPALPRIHLFVSNGTPLTVTVKVNGTPVATSAPGAPPEVPGSALPALPWSVAATTASGRVLVPMTVSEADAAQPDASSRVIPMGRVDLSCGRLTLWAGDYAPSGPVPPSPAGSPGDCAP